MGGRVGDVRLNGAGIYDCTVCGMNALVPTGTSAFNDPAAFVTTTPSVSVEKVGKKKFRAKKNLRRTDHILYAKSCHESNGIHHGIERVSFIGMKLGLIVST